MNEPHDPNVTADLSADSLRAADPLATADHACGSASTDGSQPGADWAINAGRSFPVQSQSARSLRPAPRVHRVRCARPTAVASPAACGTDAPTVYLCSGRGTRHLKMTTAPGFRGRAIKAR